MISRGLMSSNHNEWRTPPDLFGELDEEFHFTLDVASTDENALCEKHYTIKEDGLSQLWEGNVWCNPPYGKEISSWVRKACETDLGGGCCLSGPRSHRYSVVA